MALKLIAIKKLRLSEVLDPMQMLFSSNEPISWKHHNDENHTTAVTVWMSSPRR